MVRLTHLRNTTVECTDNMKDKNMFNSQQYTIKSVTNDKVVIKENEEEFTMDDSERTSILLSVSPFINTKAMK